jgi:hypothetical protein
VIVASVAQNSKTRLVKVILFSQRWVTVMVIPHTSMATASMFLVVDGARVKIPGEYFVQIVQLKIVQNDNLRTNHQPSRVKLCRTM